MSANQPWRLTMLMLLSLLLISCGVRNARCSTVPADSSTDMLWLLDFKAVTNDSTQALSSWNRCTPHCLWKGVNCSLAHPGRVTALNLTGQNLQGKIAPSLGNLTFLTTLLLSSNGFFGQLPTLNRLHRLQYLDLGGNKLQGFNPDALRNCSNLTSLDLSFNLITGSLPPNIGSLSSLVYLNLVENSFSGIIPPSIQNITNLQFLALSDNQIQGNIPVELGQLPDITRLLLGGNSLSGRIPTTLLNNSALLVLDLNSNFLQMKLPSNIGDTLPNLLALNLQGNMLEGRIPASLGNASFLCIIYLSYNNLTGQIPASFGNLRAMTDLKLDNNKFEAKDNQGWKFLDALSNCGSLQVLALNDNQLNGAIPNSVGNLSTSLKKLGFHHNYLSGTVPEGIRNLTGLTMLLLDHNNLTGPIGAWVGNLKNLSVVTLSDNNFTGLIPSSIGSLTQLTKLFLSRNNFEGPIPPSLGNLPLLLQLHLSNNSLKGHIPTELFSPLSAMTNCVISYNNLDGPIPPEISNLKHLIELDLSSNKLSGQVPATLGECQGLEILLVDNNFLSGNIPMSMSGLKSLSMLNLSHNNFSGYITIELSNLPYLTQLDLSYNNLQGEIPRDGVFRNATAISVEGNWGLCGGVIDLHMPMCHTVSRKSSLGLSVGIGMGSGAGLLLMVLGALFLTRRLKRRRAKMLKQKFFKQNRGYLLQQLVSQNTDIAERMIIPLVELEKATNNFDKAREIGGGGHGTVYKGIMSDLHVVAIKKSKVAIQREIDEFINEVAILSQINHRNVVKLFGCCLETEVPLLVYEFISNGTLYHHLHVDEPESSLPWVDRLRIATETARALAYLHSAVSFPIVHRDIKSQNILIDGNLIAKVSDFGASRCIPINQTGNATAIQGTFGYLDPMYYYSGRLTEKSDVYSFGVLLMELLTKKKPCSFRSEDEESLVAYFTALLATSDLVRVLDPQVVVEGAKEVEEVAMLAGACVRMDGDHRPTMRQVEMTLESLRVPHENVNVYEMDAPTYAVVGGKSAEEVSRQYSLEEEYLLSSRYPR